MKTDESQKGENPNGQANGHTDINTEDEETIPLNIDEDTTGGEVHSKYTVPQDRGWAWVILAGCVFRIFIFGGLMQSFGVFFLQYQKRFNASASKTATMSVVQNLVISVSALFVMTIGLKKFSSRTMVMTGGLFISVSYLITAFTTNIYLFYFVQGVLGGIGLSCISGPMFAILGVYFSKHKSLANSIFTASGSAGGLVFGPVVIKLFEHYGFTGALLIVAALMANIVVAGALMRPPEFYTKHAPAKKKIGNVGITAGDTNLEESDTTSKHGAETQKEYVGSFDMAKHEISSRKGKIEMHRMLSYDPALLKTMGSHSPMIIRAQSVETRRRRTVSEDVMASPKEKGSLNKLSNFMTVISRSQAGMYVSEATVCGSFVDISTSVPSSPTDAPHQAISEEKETCCQSIRSGFVSVWRTVFDLRLLKDVSFLYFLVMAFCGVSSVGLVPIFIPTYANEIGVSNERLGLLVSVIATIDFFAKIGMGVVADRKWIARNHILGLAFFVVGTACHFIRFIKTFEMMLIFVIISGVCCGQYVSTFAVILSDLVGQERFRHSFGFCTLTHGISIAIFFPLAGLIKDNTKSYANALHLTGALAFVAGFCALTIPYVQKWATSRQKQTDPEKK